MALSHSLTYGARSSRSVRDEGSYGDSCLTYESSWKRFRTASGETDLITDHALRLLRRRNEGGVLSSVLDIGCGDGVVLSALLSTLGVVNKAVLVEPRPTLLTEAVNNLTYDTIARELIPILGRFEDVQERARDHGPFDLILLSHVVYYIEPSTLHRALTWLTSHGRAIVVTNQPGSPFDEVWRHYSPGLSRRVDDAYGDLLPLAGSARTRDTVEIPLDGRLGFTQSDFMTLALSCATGDPGCVEALPITRRTNRIIVPIEVCQIEKGAV